MNGKAGEDAFRLSKAHLPKEDANLFVGGVLRPMGEAPLDLNDLLWREAERVGTVLNHTQEQLGRLVLTIAWKLADSCNRLFESLSHSMTLARHGFPGAQRLRRMCWTLASRAAHASSKASSSDIRRTSIKGSRSENGQNPNRP